MKIKRGSTSVRRLIFIADSSSTTGAGLANLAHNSAGLVAYYFAGDLSNEVQITLATATLGTYTSGGFVAVDNTNMPGWYEIGIPDAALDGGNECAIQLRGATNMVPVNVYIELDAFDYQTATQPVNVTQISGDATAADNLEAALDGTGGVTLSVVLGTDAIAAASLAASAVAEIQSGLSTLDAASVRTAIGLASANMDTQLAALAAYVDTLETTLNALSTKFGGITLLKNWLALIMGKTADTTTRAEVNATTAGATFNETTDSLEAQKDNSTGALTSEQDATLTAIATAVSGGAIEPTSRVASGGTITAYIGDDFKVRSDTELSLSVSDVGGTLYTKWNAITAANLYFGASREGADVGAITGTVASITSVGSGASQTCKLTVEITNCGSGLKPGTYDYQIEQRQTQGSDVDSFIEVAGSLILKRNSVA